VFDLTNATLTTGSNGAQVDSLLITYHYLILSATKYYCNTTLLIQNTSSQTNKRFGFVAEKCSGM
jgi:hypothetical protein